VASRTLSHAFVLFPLRPDRIRHAFLQPDRLTSGDALSQLLERGTLGRTPELIRQSAHVGHMSTFRLRERLG